MKSKILLIVFSGLALIAKAQQLQTSSMYDMQGFLHNPSTVGVQETNLIGMSYKSQWSGISGAPKTATVFGSFALPQQKMGIGGYLYKDKTGLTSRTGVNLALAKHVVGAKGTFSLGIETKLQQYAIDKSKLSETLGNDPVIAGADNRFNYDAGFGLSYTTKLFQVGASVSQLVQSKLKFYSGNISRTEEAKLYRHYYMHGMYNWFVDGVTVISPNALFIYVPNAPSTFQFGARVEHNKSIWWGLGYRADQSFMLSAGFHIQKKITVGYAYDDYITPISRYDGGYSAHEIMVRFNLEK